MDKRKQRLKVASVWSGGKDSCLACFKAIQDGYRVKCLFNLISKQDNFVSFHKFSKEMTKIQSAAVCIPIFQKEICSQKENKQQFEKELREIILKLKNIGIEALVFGYLLSGDYQRALVKRLCSELNLKLIEPLYKRNSKRVLTEFIRLGFKAVIVSVDLAVLDSYWIGRLVNEDFIKYLASKPDVDFCGDRGEYHTFVIDGPLFKKIIRIQDTSKVYINNHCFLDIRKYDIVKKSLKNRYKSL
jgi:uncharacterized protein (TIGR00290 family)